MLVYGPKRPFLLRYGSRDTRRVDFPRVDGQSTDPQVLGRHILSICGNDMVTNYLYQFQVEVVFSIPIAISCCIFVPNFNFMLYFNSQFQFHVVF